jgi:uncharacterized surface anchored protein
VSSNIVPAGQCESFANTLWESRSSGSSFTSNPEDVESQGSNFSTCQPATIQVHKLDGDTNKGLAGAQFSLFAGSATTGTPLATCTSADGTGTTPLGDCDFPETGSGTSTYTVVETSPPPGYSLPASTSKPCSITFKQTAQPDACDLTFNDTPAPGSITIQKNDANGKGLPGAVFTLYTDDGSTVTMGDSPTSPDSDDHLATGDATNLTCQTDGNGACTFQSVIPGTYTVFETFTPLGYETASSESATVGLGSTPGTGQNVIVPAFADPYAPATINVIKHDNSGNAVNGAVFSLYAGSSATGTPLASCTSGQPSGQSSGDCTLGNVNISQGSTFTIGEMTAPNGYAGASPQTFTVVWTNVGQTITKTFADTPVPGTINIQKNDGAGKALAGAVFGLYTDSGAPVSGGDSPTNFDNDDTAVTAGGSNVTCTTNSLGKCSFTNVPLGTYTVFETATPAGYQTANAQTVTIGLGSAPGTGDTESLTFADPSAPATINIIKQDNSTPPNAVNGAVFTLYQGTSATGTVLATCTTGQPSGQTAGACSLGNVNVTQGTQFLVVETTAPNGYAAAPNQPVTVVWTNSPQTIPLTFTDTPVPGTINIQKFDDASPPNSLNGATFTLYKDGSEPTGDSATAPDGDDTAVTGTPSTVTCTTAGGVCSLTNVRLGSYTVFETTTPAGYQTAPAQDVTIGLGPAANVGDTKTLSFTDPRLHKEIVLVCSEGTNTLDSSTVTIDGGTAQQSIDETATLPSGVTQASLCGLGGATKSDLPDGASSTAQIAIH